MSQRRVRGRGQRGSAVCSLGLDFADQLNSPGIMWIQRATAYEVTFTAAEGGRGGSGKVRRSPISPSSLFSAFSLFLLVSFSQLLLLLLILSFSLLTFPQTYVFLVLANYLCLSSSNYASRLPSRTDVVNFPGETLNLTVTFLF